MRVECGTEPRVNSLGGHASHASNRRLVDGALIYIVRTDSSFNLLSGFNMVN